MIKISVTKLKMVYRRITLI
jgi:Zn-dependent M32 family carboxypeptidase